ncbi:hypothetical protein OESDEN_08263 [Oesophagostomum dentatum]|uniref:Uncharacterized protein n=1 Tax=Oesophagostomum dentatum TaxID=61180 RepID=A0A0B1T2R3_OESDE|nr:hypothetical protein OESDEN_08263 [Oesophagostomum dentatum]
MKFRVTGRNLTVDNVQQQIETCEARLQEVSKQLQVIGIDEVRRLLGQDELGGFAEEFDGLGLNGPHVAAHRNAPTLQPATTIEEITRTLRRMGIVYAQKLYMYPIIALFLNGDLDERRN